MIDSAALAKQICDAEWAAVEFVSQRLIAECGGIEAAAEQWQMVTFKNCTDCFERMGFRNVDTGEMWRMTVVIDDPVVEDNTLVVNVRIVEA